MIMNTRPIPRALVEGPMLEACSRDDVDRLEWLLGHGAVPNRRAVTVAAEADAVQALEMLLARGADPNGTPRRRPVHACCANDGIQCLKLLLRYGADPRGSDLRGFTPADIADVYGARRCLALLRTYQFPPGPPPLPIATNGATLGRRSSLRGSVFDRKH